MAYYQPSQEKPGRTIAYLSSLGLSQLHRRNPFVVAVWSAIFPGFGHMLLSRYLVAYMLFFWEIIINVMSHVNLALFYTVLGEIDVVKEIVDIRWSLLYVPTYLFAVWDSYRSAVGLNKQFMIASREDKPVRRFLLSSIGINYIEQYPPTVPASWCLLTPGLGQLRLNRFVNGFFIISWWVLIVYMSDVLHAIFYTCIGQFDNARFSLDIQWVLNLPSVFFFCSYATYVNTVENNKLFAREQSRFLRNNYQSAAFPFPHMNVGESSSNMYVISIFEQTVQVELALSALEEQGIHKNNILATSIEKESRKKKLFDSMHASTDESIFDLAMILATFSSLFGCIYGFILSWGPVIWGVICAFVGFSTGLLIKILFLKKKKKPGCENEVVIVVSCIEHTAETIMRLLRDNGARGVNIIKGGTM